MPEHRTRVGRMRWGRWSAAGLVVATVACASQIQPQDAKTPAAPDRTPTATAHSFHEAPALDPAIASLKYMGTREIGFTVEEDHFERQMDSFRMSNHGPTPIYYQVSVDLICLPRQLAFLSDDGARDEDLWITFCPFGIVALPVQPGESVEMNVEPREGWAGRLGILCWTEEPENGYTSDPAHTAMLWSEPYRSRDRVFPPRECE